MLVSLAILGLAIAVLVVQRSLVAPAPSRSAAGVGQSTGAPTAPDEPDGVVPDGVVDEADGFVPDGVAVSVFDEETPAVGRLDPDLLDALRRTATDAEADGVGLRVNSGWRSPEYQWQLLQDAVAEYGSQEEAARWVATAETSPHVSGDAVDIGPVDAAAWLSEHGATHGLCQIYSNEPWHYELRPDDVDDGCPPMYADPTEDPRMQR
ncbi:MAG TPA: M15 family metallopeptidase [Acidimicrobiales bacterium]|nr:M15 family metallopeptidase [Acidimicrobiales bacterium]